MDNDNKYIHDAYISYAERTTKRLWITIILLIVLCVASNLAQYYISSSYTDEETTTIDATQDGAGINIIGGGNTSYVAESQDYSK